MPIYELECIKCKEKIEVLQGYYDERPTKHEECGGKLKQIFSVPTVRDAMGKTVGSIADYNASKMTDSQKEETKQRYQTEKTSDLPGYKPDLYNKFKEYKPGKKK
jgi:putative FmdB family regulatory protein